MILENDEIIFKRYYNIYWWFWYFLTFFKILFKPIISLTNISVFKIKEIIYKPILYRYNYLYFKKTI